MKIYQFPLCLLAGDHPQGALLQLITSYTACCYADMLKEKLSEEELEAEAEGYHNPPRGCDNALKCAFGRLHMVNGVCATVREEGAAVRQEKERWESVHGKDTPVYIGHALIWGLKDGGDTSLEDFRIICAINSVCGIKQRPTIIRRSLILARMVGCKSPAVLMAENKRRTAKTKLVPLSTMKLRTRLNRLQESGVIARVAADRRNTWFAPGNGFEALLETVVQRKKAGMGKVEMQAKMAKMRLSGVHPLGSHNPATIQPLDNHSVTTKVVVLK